MASIKRGQIVKFHTPFEDEDPNHLYVTLEVNKSDDRTRVRIYPLNTGLSFPPISTVYAEDLEVDTIQSLLLEDYLKRLKTLDFKASDII